MIDKKGLDNEASTNTVSSVQFGTTDIALIAMTFIWGLNYIVVKTTIAEILPFAFVAVRFGTASVLFLLVVRVSQRGFFIPRHAWGKIALLGLLGTTVYQTFFLTGLASVQASVSALILASSPAFVVLFNRLIHQERLAARGWVGLLLSFMGLGLVILSGGGTNLSAAALLGSFFILVATFAWSLNSVISAPLLKRYSSLSVAALSTIFGTIPLLFIGIPALTAQNWAEVTTGGWLGLLYSTVLAVVLAFVLWNVGVKRIGSARTAIYNNLTPVIATFGAAIFLGEALTVAKITGAVVIFIGLYLARTANIVREPEA